MMRIASERHRHLRQRGVSLIELMIVMAIVGILMMVSGVSLYQSSSLSDVLNCAKRISADIDAARRYAQGSGGRVVFLTSFPGPSAATGDVGAVDLDGDGNDEFYMSFDDSNTLARTGRFIDDVTTPTGGSRDSVTGELLAPGLVHGTEGDPLCNEQIVFKQESTLRTGMSSGSSGVITTRQNGMLIFSAIGTLLNFGAANQNLYLEKNGQVARLEVVGLTGITRMYINRPAYENCGGADCAPGTANWQALNRSL